MHTPSREANLLGALGLALAERLTAACEPAGGPTAAEALVALSDAAAGASIDALAGIVGLSHSGTVRVVDRLERDELVERRRAADQRSTALFLTPSGRRLAGRVLTRKSAEMHAVLTSLTDGQQEAFLRLSERLLRELGVPPEAERRLCRLCDVESCGRGRGRCPVMVGQVRGPVRRRARKA